MERRNQGRSDDLDSRRGRRRFALHHHGAGDFSALLLWLRSFGTAIWFLGTCFEKLAWAIFALKCKGPLKSIVSGSLPRSSQ